MSDHADTLIRALEDAGCTVRGRSVVCAFHGDRHASGSIYTGQDGRARYRCHACAAQGDAADIISLHSGRPLAEVLRDLGDGREARKPARSGGAPGMPARTYPTLDDLVAALRTRETVTAVHPYHDRAGAVVMAVVRLEPKSFRQASAAPGGGWWLRAPPAPLPIFNQPALIAADTVVVCEGERDCVELGNIGVVATTAPAGADAAAAPVADDGKPGRCDWSALAGKTVILWGDDDEPGRRHMERVARIAGRLHPRPRLRRVRRADLRGCKDAAEFIDLHDGSAEAATIAVAEVIARADGERAAAALDRRIADAAAGRLRSVPFPWPALGALTHALAPGSLAMVVGSPGASKSFMLVQAALWWLRQGWRVALHELEEPAGFWQNRALAILAGEAALTDVDHLGVHADHARALAARHADILDAFADCLTTAPAGGVTLPDLAAWVEAQARSGVRLILADPVSAALETGEKPWIAAQVFILRVKAALDASGASLILTTHQRKTAAGHAGAGRIPGAGDLDAMAGGAAFNRFSSTVITLDALGEAEDAVVIDADHRLRTVPINRRLRILKARNGKGTGWVIGAVFDPRTLCLTECGSIVTGRQTTPPTGNRHADAAQGDQER
jgi:hypothetical protein